MRLIDIDDISLRKTIACGGLSAKALWRRIQQQPTIDAVEVVRCKDCKHRYDDGWLEPRWTCDYLKDMRLKDDDFCSYGERKNDEGHN